MRPFTGIIQPTLTVVMNPQNMQVMRQLQYLEATKVGFNCCPLDLLTRKRPFSAEEKHFSSIDTALAQNSSGSCKNYNAYPTLSSRCREFSGIFFSGIQVLIPISSKRLLTVSGDTSFCNVSFLISCEKVNGLIFRTQSLIISSCSAVVALGLRFPD